MVTKSKLVCHDTNPSRFGLRDLLKIIGPLPPERESESEQKDSFDDHHTNLQMTRNVICDAVVTSLSILRSPKLPEAKEEKESPPNEESKHKPVNNIDEVIDIAAVIGVILGNPEPF